MIVDTSALIAIARRESDAHRYIDALFSSGRPRMSAATFVECGIVATNLAAGDISHDFDALIAEFGIVIDPVTVEQAELARTAHRRFGRGSGHRARLNYGDTFSYALAKATDQPLLFKGVDFVHTDLRSALD